MFRRVLHRLKSISPLLTPIALFIVLQFPADVDTEEMKASALEEYLAADGTEGSGGAGSTATLAIKRGDLLKFQQEMQGFAEEGGGDDSATAPVKVGLEAKPWYV